VPPPVGGWIAWPHRREWAGEHRVGRDAGIDEAAENVDADPDLFDNGGTIGGVDCTTTRSLGHEGFRPSQTREPCVTQAERIGHGRDGSRGGRPDGEQPCDSQRAR